MSEIANYGLGQIANNGIYQSQANHYADDIIFNTNPYTFAPSTTTTYGGSVKFKEPTLVDKRRQDLELQIKKIKDKIKSNEFKIQQMQDNNVANQAALSEYEQLLAGLNETVVE